MEKLAEQFFGTYFSEADRKAAISNKEMEVVGYCFDYVQQRFSKMGYILGLGLDFTLLAQQVGSKSKLLEAFRPQYTETQLFKAYTLIESRGGKQANTLSLEVGDNSYGIRKLEETVLKYFVALGKNSYPSAYVYNTGQWTKYKELLVKIFSLSPAGRFSLFCKLLQFGDENLITSSFSVVQTQPIGIYEKILKDYTRSDKDENGGLALQALAYGYVAAVHHHLSIVASKVRTGSARQKRFGDIDCYAGVSLAVSYEVKDIELNESNYEKQIGQFVNSSREHQVRGIVICASYTQEIHAAIAESTTRLLSLNELQHISSYWDSIKQQQSIEAVFHYLANIEQNESAVRRLRDYISTVEGITQTVR